MTYRIFTRKGCPNCPVVKERMLERFGEGEMIDCDTEEGLEVARADKVSSTPTVIFYDDKGEELGRAHTLSDIPPKE